MYILALLLALSPVEVAEADCINLMNKNDTIEGTRYLSLNHIPQEDREDYLKVASYALNTISTRRRITIPSFVDSDKTLIRFNINDYKINKINYNALGKNKIFKTKRLEEALDCENPILKVDYFIIQALSAPNYYKLLEVENLKDFRKRVGFDSEDKFQSVQGAVTDNSQIRRYATIHGYMWEVRCGKRLDYLQELFSDKFDSIQVITSNPNGLISYFVGDSKGKMYDSLESDIAIDKTLSDAVVRVSSILPCF